MEINPQDVLDWLNANPDGVTYASFYELFGLGAEDAYQRNVLRGVVGSLVRRDLVHRDNEGNYIPGPNPSPRQAAKAKDLGVDAAEEERAWEEYWRNWRGAPVLLVTAQEFRRALRVSYTPDHPGGTAQQVPLFGAVKLWLSKDAPQPIDGFNARTVVIRNVACVAIDYKDANGAVRQVRHNGLEGMHMSLYIMQWEVKE